MIDGSGREAAGKAINNKASGKVVFEARRKAVIGGVTEVISFDESSVTAQTELGCVVVRGRNLRVSSLNVNGSNIEIEGDLASFAYEEPRAKKLLSKLFK